MGSFSCEGEGLAEGRWFRFGGCGSGSGMECGGDDFVDDFAWVFVEMREYKTEMLGFRFGFSRRKVNCSFGECGGDNASFSWG